MKLVDRVSMTVITAVGSVCFLFAALIVHQTAQRLATEPRVPAKVVKAWTQRMGKGGPVYFAHLVFERKKADGETVRCDVPYVMIGPPTTAGATITIAPRTTTCWEPDVICETCVQPSNSIAWGLLMAAVASGWICFVLVRRAVRENNQPA
jgi:hypothetical protein